MHKIVSVFLVGVIILIGLIIVLVVVFAAMNRRLPQRSPVVETLSAGDKIRLAELFNLRQEVGDAVWPGWGAADIPALLYNESYAFLVRFPDPPDGWVKVPAGAERGGPWVMVESDTFDGQAYYRQYLGENGQSPEAFTVMIGDCWVSSLQTLDWARISLVSSIKRDLPEFLQPVFPYRLFTGMLVSGSDQYISLVAHESFHAYQGMMAPQKFAASESANQQDAGLYPWSDAALQASWQTELDVLAKALRAKDHDTRLELTSQFLAQRAARREQAGLQPDMVAYEQQREWVEGLARYAELEIWHQASGTAYTPLDETSQLSDFSAYARYNQRWNRELSQMRRMADDEGDGRFYYSGMAQAFLLDQLMPGWKTAAFEPDVWLDSLLEEAVSAQ